MRPVKKILFITLTVIGLSFLASSCVKEGDFDSRVNEIVAAQLDSLNKQVAALEKTQAALNDSLKSVKGDIDKLSKQSKDLTDSISAMKDSLAAQKEWTTEQLDAVGVRLGAIEEEQEAFKAEVYKRLGLLWTRIQKIDVVPDYNDGSVGIGKGDFELSFIIRPDSVAQQVADSLELFKLLATQTLTKSSVLFDTIALKGVSCEKGVVTVTVDGSKFPAKMLNSTKSHSGCLVISDGNSETTSGFFPMTQVRYPEFRDSVCSFIGGVWWATVNCGYDDTHRYGLMYQWGRKCGQTFTQEQPEPECKDISSPLTVHPDTTENNRNHYRGGDDMIYWYGGPDSNTVWNGTTKGTYDPCPSGWRVPARMELVRLFGNDSIPSFVTVCGVTGVYFNGTPTPGNTGVFLPAAGLRTMLMMDFNRGFLGCYWSSSFDDIGTSILWFNSSTSDITGKILDGLFARSQALSVRCVQE